ncbi:MAG TPA: PaaI family thioesterase, partial [Gemmatimonadaceae bacterium]|nr:PaaI family thioesterase [Gemmatimonadaceae bacterium]
YAALSLMEPGVEVVSVEFKINMLSPGVGERFVAVGRAVRSGRTISVCSGEGIAVDGGESKVVVLMQATMMAVRVAPPPA